MRRLIRRTAWVLALGLAAVLAAAALYVAAAWGFGRLAVNGDFAPPAPGTGIEIALSSNGAHTNLHLPARTHVIDWYRVFPPANAAAPPVFAGTVSIGWGDRDFYLNTPTWAEFRFVTGLRAVLGLGPAALHVAYWPPGWETVAYRRFRISEDAYRALVDYVLAAARVDRMGQQAATLIPDYSYAGNDAFYQAAGRYSPILTCNEWVRRALARAGIRTARWAVMPDPLLDHAAVLADG